ncbi:MAG: Gfo/Idh/MocA family oxidoreductase [Bacteroidales bacterium]|nr:Gfo/Idh/MocA family oxidoreductase [Lentimicrobiaceae bacterium]MDD5693790.1 Gfo/Idh/MocA family oxidoreductase [Bacteroidales bacterium]
MANFSRRDIIKGLATLPVVGAVAYGLYRRQKRYKELNRNLMENLRIQLPGEIPTVKGDRIRIGIIGTGSRGRYLLKALGYVQPSSMDTWLQNAREDAFYRDYLRNFLEQEDLNVEITALCDIFESNAHKGIMAASNVARKGSEGKPGKEPMRYKTYRELCSAPDVDAVVIATPDHWHVPMALEAARNGKHVYCEKPLSWTVEETYAIREAIKQSGVVFQLGHQGRQTDSYQVARSMIRQEVLGKVNLIEVCTNRNDPNGAWVYEIPAEAGPDNIDWNQFIGPAPWHEFSLERFFRWRCWWDYSTGLSGDLFTHEYDAMNQILDLGIPHSAVASGGIYFFKDGRTVPDVLNMSFEYPDRDLTLLYSATLASEKDRGKVIMGHDGYMDLSETLVINADPSSTRYGDKIRQGLIEPGKPIYTYVPGKDGVDAVTSATEKYFASRGLLYTYRGGKEIDTSHLHLKEWLNCIRQRNGARPSCHIDAAFEEAMTAHMGTIAYKEGRKVYWDREKEVIC